MAWSRSNRTGTVLSVVLSLLVSVAAAQSADERPIPDLADASLEQLMNIKVYSASKHLEDTREAPASVSIVTADEIQRHGYRTLADILRTVRGFYITYDRNYSYVGVRGFSRPGDYNTRVLLLVDGHRINDNIYDQAMLGEEFPVDVDLIERVEVVRGPGSLLYGSNAFFAVINVITRTGRGVDGWELSFEPASFGTYKGRASYGGAFKGAETLLSGTFSDSAGQSLFFPEFNSPITNDGIARGADYESFRDLLFTTSFRGLTLQMVDSWREKGIPTAAFGTTFNDPITHSVDQHRYVDLGYRRNLGRNWEIAIRGYYDRYAYDAKWAYPAQLTNIDYARGQQWGSELQLNRTFWRRHRVTFGSEVRDNLQQDQKNYDISPAVVYVDDRRTSWTGAGFAQDEYTITAQLKVSGGFRYDWYTRYGGRVDPRLGLIYRPLARTTFKLVYGSAFRVPNVYEAFYGTASGGLFELNSSLRPESIKSIEAVWEQGLGSGFQVSGSVFREYIDDLISLERAPVTGLLMNRNVHSARGTGAGIELTGHLPGRIDGVMAYSFTETEDQDTNQILVNSPRHLGKVALVAPLYRQKLFAGLDAQYEGSRQTLAGNRIGGFPVCNMTLSGQAWSKHLQWSASLYNLFSRRYLDVGPEEDRQDALLQDGRSFRLKMTWHFGGKQ